MHHYPVKILLALSKTFQEEDNQFHVWLLSNGYPELAAFSSAVRGSDEAFHWLMLNKFFALAALDGAIDNQTNAKIWLQEFGFDLNLKLAGAVNGDKDSIDWFVINEMEIFIILAQSIRSFRENQTFDYHKLRF